MSFRPMPFQPLQFQPFKLSIACKFNPGKFNRFDYAQSYSIFSRRSKTIKVSQESIERHQSGSPR